MASKRTPHTTQQVLAALKAHASEDNLQGMARFGIDTSSALGVRVPDIRKTAQAIEKNHDLALSLWQTGIHEARILASLVDKPQWVDEPQMDQWVADFHSWDICDQVCGNLFDRAEGIDRKISQWAERQEEKEEYVRRAAFASIAFIAVHDKKRSNESFVPFLTLIESAADDPRNFVKKAVNWALRQIGKRNLTLNREALACANRLLDVDHPAARWIARDAIRELQSDEIQQRLKAANV